MVQGLAKLQQEELSRFRQFVRSPYYNQREELSVLLEYFLQFWPDIAAGPLDKEAAFEAVLPGQEYEDKQLRYRMSWLNKLLEQFWLAEQQGSEGLRNSSLLMDQLSERGLHKAYRQTERQLEEALKQEESKDAEYFRCRLRWAEARERDFQRKRQRRYDPALQEASDQLDRYYFLKRLMFACAMLDRQAILQADYQPGLSPDWLQHLEAQAFFGEPLIEIYYFIFKALQEEADESHFRRLRSKLEEISEKVSRARLQEIYHVTINYCARKIRRGKEAYVGEALQLYTTGIEQGILLEKEELSPWTFTNVVKLALRLKRYGWIENFIQRYAPRLPDAFRENALHYNLAELYYYTERHDEAQLHLNQVAYSDLNYYLGARTMLAKIYYEQDEEEPLLSLLAAFTIFLKRNKELSGQIKQTFLHFCELLYQLVRRRPEKLQPLGERIQQTSPLTDKAWLLEQWKKKVK